MYKTREEVENWLIEMKINNYVINEDLKVDVNGYVDISGDFLERMPINFGIINGDFNCSKNSLTSLKGCPEIINGEFNCSHNQLTSLKSCCKVIKGSFNCSYNNLTNLKGCPEVINGNFSCAYNNIKSFKYFSFKIEGNFLDIYENYINEEELVNFNCDITGVNYVYSDFNIDGNKEEFLGKVNYYKIKKENELLKELRINSNNIKLNKKL